MATPAATRQESLVDQLDREKRSVSYDAYDITIRQLVDMCANGEINIAPDYQRHFIWQSDRESELIESILLGIPVPSLFMATNSDGGWEVVDGVQRLSTLLHFCGGKELIEMVRRKGPLKLSGLTKLSAFNGYAFEELPRSLQTQFTLRPLRVTTLNDKSDLEVRYELFARLNTGGIVLHPQEIRNSVYRGDLNEQIKSLSRNRDFRQVVIIRKGQIEAGYEECVVRFFAFFRRYKDFDHLVDEFLNAFMTQYNQKGLPAGDVAIFEKTMAFLVSELPDGIVRLRTPQTPVNLYEATSVGTALVIDQGMVPKAGELKRLLNAPELTRLTQGGTNTRAKVIGRIELVRDALE
jgi:hypothetical protein